LGPGTGIDGFMKAVGANVGVSVGANVGVSVGVGFMEENNANPIFFNQSGTLQKKK